MKIINIFTISFFVFSALAVFYTQFKVEDLQDELMQTDAQISTYQDEMRMLEIEWTFLTRPERVRLLANKYLQDSGYALASQIKESSEIEGLYKKDKNVSL
jgi:cell division protein FtsL